MINYRIITDDGPVLASTVTYLLPVVAVILGALVLAEPITLQLAAGVAVVLAGVALTRRTSRDPQPSGSEFSADRRETVSCRNPCRVAAIDSYGWVSWTTPRSSVDRDAKSRGGDSGWPDFVQVVPFPAGVFTVVDNRSHPRCSDLDPLPSASSISSITRQTSHPGAYWQISLNSGRGSRSRRHALRS